MQKRTLSFAIYKRNVAAILKASGLSFLLANSQTKRSASLFEVMKKPVVYISLAYSNLGYTEKIRLKKDLQCVQQDVMLDILQTLQCWHTKFVLYRELKLHTFLWLFYLS